MTDAARVVHASNADLLIVAAGTVASGNLGFLRGNVFVPEIQHSVVFESHIYNGIYVDKFWKNLGQRFTCSYLQRFLLENRNEFVTRLNPPRPYLLGEFGMDVAAYDVSSTRNDVQYMQCVTDWVRKKQVNFAYWVLVGKYYYRDGGVDSEKGWGLLQANNKKVRNPNMIEILKTL